MARARSKSPLDRLVEANRGRSKRSRKVTKQYLPPEALATGTNGIGAVDVVSVGEADDEYEEDPGTLPSILEDDVPEPEVEPESLPEPEDEPASENLATVKPKATAVARLTKPTLVKRLVSLPRITTTRLPNRQIPSDQISIGQVIVELPHPVYQNYLNQKKDGQLVRELLTKRLTDCQNHTSQKPLYFNDALRRKIEQFAHRDFSSPEEFVGWLISSLDIFIGSEGLTIEPYLMQRAVDRRPPDQTLAEYLSELLTYGIEVKTGLR